MVISRSSSILPFRVLALDGGGMRGLYSAMVLHTIASQFAEKRGINVLDVGKGFNLITGTSTGGILACGLASGLTTGEIIDLYREVGPRTFRRPMPESVFSFFRWVIRSITQSANKNNELRKALEKALGDETFLSLYQRRGIALCLPAVNMLNFRSWVYKTPHSEKLIRDKHFKLVDACIATSAAPIYLPLAGINDPIEPSNHFVFADGGLWANNPVLIGMIESLGLAAQDQPIEILSMGTCPPPRGRVIRKNKLNWGLFQWRAGTEALSAALEAQSWGYFHMAQMLAEQLKSLGRDCSVFRLPHSPLAPQQARHVGLDKASEDAIHVLSQIGRYDGDLENLMTGSQQEGLQPFLEAIFFDMPPLKTEKDHVN